MFGPLKLRSTEGQIAGVIYGAIVAQARAPALYADLGVPDTARGRFEMVVFHTTLVVDWLGRGDGVARAVGQRVFDLFCADMDGALRQFGIGDLAVPKHMNRIGGTFYSRAEAYRRSLVAGDAVGLAAVFAENVDGLPGGAASFLARYAMAAAAMLAEQQITAIADACPGFPDPAYFANAMSA
jgi:cytochrome b pre-mRNA-processing protein 3